MGVWPKSKAGERAADGTDINALCRGKAYGEELLRWRNGVWRLAKRQTGWVETGRLPVLNGLGQDWPVGHMVREALA
jgi:hypothetical protein